MCAVKSMPTSRGKRDAGTLMSPPFAYKNTVSRGNGIGYIRWLQSIHEGTSGNADLCAHFFRRAESLLGTHGTMGLIATKTIAQGDTRLTSLANLLAKGMRISS